MYRFFRKGAGTTLIGAFFLVLCAVIALVITESFKSYRLGIVAQTQADLTADAAAVVAADGVIPDYNKAREIAERLAAKNKILLKDFNISISFSEIDKAELLNNKTITISSSAKNTINSPLSKLVAVRKAKVRLLTGSYGFNTDTFPTDYHYVCYPPYENSSKAKLTADEYMRIVLQFDVEETGRYKPVGTETKQNVYIWDVTKALGCELPLFYSVLTGAPIGVGEDYISADGSLLLEETTNYYQYYKKVSQAPSFVTKCYWKEIKQSGTKEEYYKEIQQTANGGTPVLLLYTSGKTQIVMPSYYGEYDGNLGFAVSYASCIETQENKSYTYEVPYGNFVAIKYDF